MTNRTLLAALLAGALMLAACSSGGGADSLRATAQTAGVDVPSGQPAEQPADLAHTLRQAQDAAPFPTEPARIVDVQQVEVTRIVEVTQPAQVIEVTHIVEATVEVPVIVTATPDIAGFQDAGIDESVQPCPIKYWKSSDPRSSGRGSSPEDRGRGRCVATDAQIDAYANEVQP